MTRIATILLLALTIPLAARADEASHRAKAQQLMTLLRTRQMVDRNIENLKMQVVTAAGNIVGADPAPAKKADAQEFIQQADQLIDAKLSWDAMQPGITDIYVKNFTEEQLDAILAFYQSPAGSVLLTNQATVNTQVEALGADHAGPQLRPQLMQLVTSFRQKESSAPAPPPVSPMLVAPPPPSPPPPPAK